MIAGLDVLLCHIFSKNSNIYRCLVYKSNSFVKQIALSVILRCFYLLYTYVSLLLLRFTLQLSTNCSMVLTIAFRISGYRNIERAVCGISGVSLRRKQYMTAFKLLSFFSPFINGFAFCYIIFVNFCISDTLIISGHCQS